MRNSPIRSHHEIGRYDTYTALEVVAVTVKDVVRTVEDDSCVSHTRLGRAGLVQRVSNVQQVVQLSALERA